MEAPPTTGPAPALPRGRFVHGLALSLAAWLPMVLAAALITHPLVPWMAVPTGVVSSILLGKWHQRRAHPDTATGAFTGAALWPILLGLTLLALNLLSILLHDFE